MVPVECRGFCIWPPSIYETDSTARGSYSAMDASVSDTRAAYDALAPVYDGLTAHHDYERWLTQLLGLAHHHGLAGNRVLDVACGTGESFMPLVRRGYDGDRVRPIAGHGGAGTAPSAWIRRARHVADMRDCPCCASAPTSSPASTTPSTTCSTRPSCGRASPACARTCAPAACSCSTSIRWRLIARCSATASAGATASGPTRRSASGARSSRAGCSPPRCGLGGRHAGRGEPPGAAPPRRGRARGALRDVGLEPLAFYGSAADGSHERPPDEQRHVKIVAVARRPPTRHEEKGGESQVLKIVKVKRPVTSAVEFVKGT